MNVTPADAAEISNGVASGMLMLAYMAARFEHLPAMEAVRFALPEGLVDLGRWLYEQDFADPVWIPETEWPK